MNSSGDKVLNYAEDSTLHICWKEIMQTCTGTISCLFWECDRITWCSSSLSFLYLLRQCDPIESHLSQLISQTSPLVWTQVASSSTSPNEKFVSKSKELSARPPTWNSCPEVALMFLGVEELVLLLHGVEKVLLLFHVIFWDCPHE